MSFLRCNYCATVEGRGLCDRPREREFYLLFINLMTFSLLLIVCSQYVFENERSGDFFEVFFGRSTRMTFFENFSCLASLDLTRKNVVRVWVRLRVRVKVSWVSLAQ